MRWSLSYDSRYADLPFEVVTRRYDAQKPVLLSTNKAISEWKRSFPHAACVVTLVDRLIHRAEVIDLDAESYYLLDTPPYSTLLHPRHPVRCSSRWTWT